MPEQTATAQATPGTGQTSSGTGQTSGGGGGGGGEAPLVLVRRIEGVLVEGSKARAEFEVAGQPQDDGEFEFHLLVRIPSFDVSSPQTGAPLEATLRRNVHVVSLQATGLGNVPLANQRVRIIDPDSREPVGDPIETDENGRLIAEVPENKPYDIEVVDDDDLEPEPVPDQDNEETELESARYHLLIVGRSGQPLANEPIRLIDEGRTTEGRTDENGIYSVASEPGACEVEVRGTRRKAHTLFDSDIEADPAPYRLVYPV